MVSCRCAVRISARQLPHMYFLLPKVVRLRDRKIILDEELYEDFEKNYKCKRTVNGTHHFHIMEFESFIAGGGP